MVLIDTHTHLDAFIRRGELPAVLARARTAGVGRMIAVGTEPKDWRLYREAAGAHPDEIHFTAGLHPCSVDEHWRESLAGLQDFWGQEPRPVAVGETGLDRFHLPKDDPAAAGRLFAWQQAAFVHTLGLAKRLGCPVVVHSRGAFQECVRLIDESGVDWSRVVFHCFTEGPAEMSELTRRGGRGSFTGIITYKTAGSVRAAALAQGPDCLMLETDAPYLTPMPHRGKPNEPAYLRHTAEFCAGLFGLDFESLAEITSANARKFFALPR